MDNKACAERTIWVLIRVSLGWLYLWAFFDKMFGLGFATSAGSGWTDGGSPTFGYLTHATKGPFMEIYQSLAASALVEWLFMLGLLFVGMALVSGALVRLGALAGALFSVLFYTSGFMPPEHNPFLDEHVIYFILFIGLYIMAPTSRFDISRIWRRIPLVQRYRLLE